MRLSLAIILFLSFIISGCSTVKPSELKGYYKPLVVNQYSLNKEDRNNQEQYVQAIINGKEASLMYCFQIDSEVLYIMSYVVYTKEGLELIALQPKSEGYFIDEDNLYYVYGNEKRKKSNTLGGPVNYTLKDYKYRKLDLLTNKEIKITKDEYETLYFKLNNELSMLVFVNSVFLIRRIKDEKDIALNTVGGAVLVGINVYSILGVIT